MLIVTTALQHTYLKDPAAPQVGFSNIGDALVTRQACIALSQLSRLPERLPHSSMQAVYKALAHTLLSDSLPSSTWYTAAEAAVTAVYALHPAPQELAQAVLSQLGKAAFEAAPGSVAASGVLMSVAPISKCESRNNVRKRCSNACTDDKSSIAT